MSANQDKLPLAKDLSSLSLSELMVYNALIKMDERTDISKIAKECRLTDLQVVVALQLLIHKNLIPSDIFLP
ncbi:hypothetical protein [Cohnella candidum]|uniref:MarR family transcriptional regulator n=1 Tax=Cohnella candidum TaxID=2674991 RepID=A0A3G3JW02_9BACL|nr:hypothetical protein [Cohnella candidum]AYQ72430.1 hypothetical protein EAV92_07515 [Cohnella candidum]